jgi:hypothetical protein
METRTFHLGDLQNLPDRLPPHVQRRERGWAMSGSIARWLWKHWIAKHFAAAIAALINATRRQAFLEAAGVASTIRDEYEAAGKNVALGVRARDRANRDATVARQIKGAILTRAGIQEWPAPKLGDSPALRSEATSAAVASAPRPR